MESGVVPGSSEVQVAGSSSPFERSEPIARPANHRAANDYRRLRGNRYPNPDCKRLEILGEFSKFYQYLLVYSYNCGVYLPCLAEVPEFDKTVELLSDRKKGKQTMNPNILKNMNQTPSEPVASTSVHTKKSVRRKADAPSSTKTEVSKSKAREKMDAQISNEQVALRAYFIGERRRQLGFPGDETSDSVDKREISEELKAR